MTEEKVPFAQIYHELRMDSAILDNRLADLAEVTPVAVYKMRRGDPVMQWQAEEVLKALSQMIGIIYTLETIAVVLYPEADTSQ